jgi:hypothetical protein
MRHSSTILLVTFALAAPAAAQAQINQAVTPVTSRIEAVTVYPDGATVTRAIRVDLPQGDSVLRAEDFPPALDPASLRVEGDAQAQLVVGGIDARPPRAERPPTDPAIEGRIEALKDERANSPPALPKPHRSASATRARLGRLRSGARPLRRWPRKSPRRMPPFAKRG